MFYQKYRPTDLEAVRGNEETIESLKALFDSEEPPPHAFLFTGPTGCGKTTLARIVAGMLGCVGGDYREIDSADFRGIDMVREMRKQAQFKPLEGPVRVWLIDECFAKGTQITMADGNVKNIEDVCENDCVRTLDGSGLVSKTFRNKVPLSRVIKVVFSDGTAVFCSKEHEFLTITGWKRAIDLNNTDLLFTQLYGKLEVGTSNQLTRSCYDAELLSSMWRTVTQKAEELLLRRMRTDCLVQGTMYGCQNLRSLRECVYSPEVRQTGNMWKNMWKYFGGPKQNRTKAVSPYMREDFRKSQNIFAGDGSRKELDKKAWGAYAQKQPHARGEGYSENVANQKNKWNASLLAWRAWWKRKVHEASNFISHRFGMGDGGPHKNGAQCYRPEWISTGLQSRFGQSEIKDCCGGGWIGTQFEKSTIFGQKEAGQVGTVGVASITCYERGNNDETFTGVIDDKERNSDFVDFFDLEIAGHPSYYANGVLVHNCHKLTSDAMNAMLKLLEDPPKSAYFILATTDPQKLISTIKGRCVHFAVKQLPELELKKLLRGIANKEGFVLPKEVMEQIIEDSQGHPRNAIQLLEQVANVPQEKMLQYVKRAAEVDAEVIQLCRKMIDASPWKAVANILKGLKENGEDPEGIRRAILGYCTSILLQKEDMRTAAVMECFTENYYNTGFSGLVLSCFTAKCAPQ